MAEGEQDVFDELVETTRVRSMAASREIALIARACDEYEIIESDLYEDPPLDACLMEAPVRSRGAVLGGERWVPGGADGTPHVGEFLALELAGILGCSTGSATAKIADALNLRHRHPLLWDAVIHEHRLEAWQAVAVAREASAAGLGLEASLRLDRELASAVGLLGWPRARRLLKGLIVRVDPGLAARRAAEARERRGVWVTLTNRGVVDMSARLDGAEGLSLEAQVARIAELLATDGDTRDRQQRRATALAMLAVPHLAAAFLEDHSGGPAATAPELATGMEVAAGAGGPVRRIDPEKLRPRVNLYLHLHADDVTPSPAHGGAVTHPEGHGSGLTHPEGQGSGVARVEGHGAVPVGTLRELLNGCHVTVRPVIDLNQPPTVDRYEVPDRLREHVIARNPVEVFPWSARPSRGCQLHHTVPYDHALSYDPAERAPQTRADNLGPLGITVHRAKTHGRWQLSQPEPGVFFWRSRAGYRYMVAPAGTIPLGRDPHHTKIRSLGGAQAGRRPPPTTRDRAPVARADVVPITEKEPPPPY
ncbi:MAG: DUF222 domain-containing protein [Propioniciclava sp.]|uniref:DUF222 domain-containing protein n=1 Tax=Propioniciclava sp. TaxID=2038686 RepID=UPI0039E4B1F3